jgi:hypothetical protein
MYCKSPFSWDFEQATLQVNPSWYEEYWLKPKKASPPNVIVGIFCRIVTLASRQRSTIPPAKAVLHSSDPPTGGYVRRRPDGSIDFDFYRGCAKRERGVAIKKFCGDLLVMLVRLFRPSGSMLCINQAAPTRSIDVPAAPVPLLRISTM